MKIEFYHTFNLPDGRKFEGQWDLNPTAQYLDQIDVRGKTLLDVACRDGWYGFEFEKRGAIVTGMDIDNRDAREYIGKTLCSRNQFIHSNIYAAAKLPAREFDIVFAGDILCHLESPLRALQIFHHLAKENVYIVADCYEKTSVWYHGYPWKFSEADLLGLMGIAGMGNIKILGRYQIVGEYWRRGGFQHIRDVALFSCCCDPDYSLPDQERIEPKSLNSINELTYEVEE